MTLRTQVVCAISFLCAAKRQVKCDAYMCCAYLRPAHAEQSMKLHMQRQGCVLQLMCFFSACVVIVLVCSASLDLLMHTHLVIYLQESPRSR